jgi:hypothetical protein
MSRLKRFAAFWYDFVVGDDWRVAVGVVVALAATAALHHASVPAWWVVPVAVALLLPYTLWRVARRTEGRAARRTEGRAARRTEGRATRRPRNPPPS